MNTSREQRLKKKQLAAKEFLDTWAQYPSVSRACEVIAADYGLTRTTLFTLLRDNQQWPTGRTKDLITENRLLREQNERLKAELARLKQPESE